jgi:hypothetical protein
MRYIPGKRPECGVTAHRDVVLGWENVNHIWMWAPQCAVVSTTPKYFTFMWPCIMTNFLIIKPTRCSISQIYFGNETLRVSESSSVHNQDLFTAHTAMVYVTQVSRQLSSSTIRMELSSILILLKSCLQTCMTYTIAECTVNNSWWWTEELYEICRVSFPKINEKLATLVGFIIRKPPSSQCVRAALAWANSWTDATNYLPRILHSVWISRPCQAVSLKNVLRIFEQLHCHITCA